LAQIRGKLTMQKLTDSIKVGKSSYFGYEKEERILVVKVIGGKAEFRQKAR